MRQICWGVVIDPKLASLIAKGGLDIDINSAGHVQDVDVVRPDNQGARLHTRNWQVLADHHARGATRAQVGMVEHDEFSLNFLVRDGLLLTPREGVGRA